MAALSYPPLHKWSIKSLRESLNELNVRGLHSYPDKTISGMFITRAMLLKEIGKRSPGDAILSSPMVGKF